MQYPEIKPGNKIATYTVQLVLIEAQIRDLQKEKRRLEKLIEQERGV